MYWILNNKVDDTSNKGILSLLDFIFSKNRTQEKVLFRKIREEEEEKEKQLAKIQESTGPKVIKLDAEGQQEQVKEESEVKTTSEVKVEIPAVPAKQKQSKREVKKERKDANKKKIELADMADDLIAEMQAPVTDEAGNRLDYLGEDKEVVKLVKNGGIYSTIQIEQLH